MLFFGEPRPHVSQTTKYLAMEALQGDQEGGDNGLLALCNHEHEFTHKQHIQFIPDVEEKVQALLNGGQNMVKSYVVSGLPFPLPLSYWECG